MFWTNIILLLSLLIMFATAVYLFRDGEGKGPSAGPGIRPGEDTPPSDPAERAADSMKEHRQPMASSEDDGASVQVRVTQDDAEGADQQRAP